MPEYSISIAAGRIDIATEREDVPLREILTFASRENARRTFLFVSKILGKHVPCRPRAMRESYRRLATKLTGLESPVMTVGMAETAVGLGHGIHHSLHCQSPDADLVYIHTTRHHLERPPTLVFDECHSHAPEHLVYCPDEAYRATFDNARSLVLVDDEISTGRTMTELATSYLRHNPRIEQVAVVSIVNWLSRGQRAILHRKIGRPLLFASLVDGCFHFRHATNYSPPTARRGGLRRTRLATARFGRAGIGTVTPTIPHLTPRRKPILVVGTGEFVYPPFLIAENLENRGYDVLFQSTTRSPIALGDGIVNKLTFEDNYGEQVPNFLYNAPHDRDVILSYEHPDMPSRHGLATLLEARGRNVTAITTV